MKQGILLALWLLTHTIATAQNMERVRQNLQALSAPAMHGRGYVAEGDKKAAAFIREQFVKSGLKSFTPDYYQHFTLLLNTFPEDVELEVDDKELIPGRDFILDAASAGGEGKAKVVYFDTLVFQNEAAGTRFLALNLKKKALVIRQQDYDKLVILPDGFRKKIFEVRALVILKKDKLTATVAKEQLPVPVFEVLQSSWPANTKKIEFEVDADFKPEYQTQNVIAFVPGSVYPDSFVVFTAHYDHLGRQGEDVYFPGANDNASGTAMLLELAHWYAQPQHKPPYSVAFIAFGAEEAGLVGSAYYTQHPFFPLRQISFLINIDLMGTGDAGMMVVNGKVFTSEYDQLVELNKQMQYLPELRSRGKAANSDHYHFTEKGVKSFFFYTLGGSPAYHHVDDVAEALPLTKFPEVFKLIRDFAALRMQQPQR
ncbi:MAG: M20/M25/M40 family metallo-hydrolase [Hymenobacteraceae bacterium]|nr:M20/M25/M40 family metallo-hydrolase [Hymenobacteraceae bacterium]